MCENVRFVLAVKLLRPKVKEGLARMVKWYKEGMPDDRTFSKYTRLCTNMFIDTGIEYALDDLFIAYGLSFTSSYPFEGGHRIEVPEDIYKNPLRVKFLLDVGAVLKEEGYDC
ncbi:hypothetical protein X832_gp114 [Pseudomonas phage PAK_P5]|uniref:Uncharacterized protein n=1 Tax=Pseudomonas phage PAK_P5 TaxID=1327964 RepID=V5JXF4_9CAUD|nr:hypothetical protein X832_gp114 [Pseudomonas phage PAK_P5]AGR89584.1 hypothetical protein PAK_P500114 [Pseudomonas phage PAK_P5]